MKKKLSKKKVKNLVDRLTTESMQAKIRKSDPVGSK